MIVGSYRFTNLSGKEEYNQSEVDSLLNHFSELMDSANRHDVDKHLSFYLRSPHLLFTLNNETIRGWGNLRNKQAEWWNHGKTDVHYELKDLRISLVSETAISTLATFSGQRTGETGQKRLSDFSFSALWLKREKGWRIDIAHESMAIQP